MRSAPFTLLVLACLLLLLGARFGAEALVGPAAAAEHDATSAPDAVMALPPKPEGLTEPSPDAAAGGGSQAVLTLESCLAMAADVRDVCLQALARQTGARDPQGALQVCEKISDAELALECRADVAESVAPIDRDAGVKICDAIEVMKWRGQCHFGMGLALADKDPTYALGQCEHAEAFRDFCRHDVVGTVSLTNLPAALAFCGREEGDALTRGTCWHGIGKYLARRDFDEAATACNQATEQWRGRCFHGIGWGAAERDPDGTLAHCATGAGPYADNCRQGVAHELKRFDPERGLAICEAIQTDTVRDNCLNFLKR